jgi:hypothetical protein
MAVNVEKEWQLRRASSEAVDLFLRDGERWVMRLGT